METKLYIQDLVKKGKLDLVTSFMLEYENGKNKYTQKREIIAGFMSTKDAIHVACAVLASCDYFITTDDRLLKYQTKQMPLVTPGEFIRRLEVDRDV